MPRYLFAFALLVFATSMVSPLCGDEQETEKPASKESGEKSEKKKDDKKESDPEPSITQHKVTIDGKEIAYTATAREMVMKNDEGEKKARVFFIAYTKDGEESASERPVTFCFNGGPGSSSVWLHLGMLGPKRIKLPDDASSVRPPQQVTDNPFSLLDITDLVFIDPVSTGYSRPEKGISKQQFHGYEEDLRSVGQFIHDYTTEYGRWSSPKFLLGESYGGLRASGLSGTLQQRYRMYLNGIVLVSAVVDFRTLRFSTDNDLAYALFLPTYTATAWYHKALPPKLQNLPLKKAVARAEQFAFQEYFPALVLGDKLSEEQEAEVAKKYAKLTGLSKKYVLHSKLRVPMWRFSKELLRDRERTLGRFDSRYLGIDREHAGEGMEYDPSGAALFGPYTSAMNDYLHRHLKYKSERVYEILTDRVHPWSYDRFKNRYVNASETLRSAMTENPYLKVFAACGYYDLATPFFAMKYTRNHLGLDETLQENFSMGFYEGGHMMYVHEPSLKKLRRDLLDFYEETLGETE